MMSAAHNKMISRRTLLLGAGASAVGGGLLTLGATQMAQPADDTEEPSPDTTPIADPRGAEQAGISRPATPQPHALIIVADVDTTGIWEALAELGTHILELVDGNHPTILTDGPGDLSVSVGVGPRILGASSQGGSLTDLLAMPTYRGDELLPDNALGGDILLSIHSSNPVDLEPVYRFLQESLPGFSLQWSQMGFRGPGDKGVARNPFGYHDGVTVPRSEEDLKQNVWIPSGPLKGGTICVLRSFLLDTQGFRSLPPARQDGVMGRAKVSGIPLGGTKLHEDANVSAKTPTGDFVIPADSHVRAAHPSFTGSKLMLRRSYSFTRPDPEMGSLDQGLVFISFQNDIRTFILTQQRLDEIDALMEFSTPVATAAFVMLPGFDENTPLGHPLA